MIELLANLADEFEVKTAQNAAAPADLDKLSNQYLINGLQVLKKLIQLCNGQEQGITLKLDIIEKIIASLQKPVNDAYYNKVLYYIEDDLGIIEDLAKHGLSILPKRAG